MIVKGGQTEGKFRQGFLTLTREEEERTQGKILTPKFIVDENADLREVVTSAERGAFVVQSVLAPPRVFGQFGGTTLPKQTFLDVQDQIKRADVAFGNLQELKSEFQSDPESFIGKEGVEVKEIGEDREVTLSERFVQERVYSGEGTSSQLSGKEAFTKVRDTPVAFESITKEMAVGLGQLLASSGEFITSLIPRQVEIDMTKPIETKKLFGIPYSIDQKPFELQGGLAIGLKSQPLGAPGRLAQIVYVGSKIIGGAEGFKELKAEVGFKGALTESVVGMSPIQFKPTIYTYDITPDEQFDVEVFKAGSKSFAVGNAKDIPVKFYSKIVSKPTGTTLQETTFFSPATSYRPATGFTNLKRITTFQGITTPATLGRDVVASGYGFTASTSGATAYSTDALFRIKYDVFAEVMPVSGGQAFTGKAFGQLFPSNEFQFFKPAGVYKPTDPRVKLLTEPRVTLFKSGQLSKFYGTSVYEDVIIYEPKSFFKPVIRGIQYDLTGAGGGNGGTYYIPKTAGAKTPFSATFTAQQQTSSFQIALPTLPPPPALQTPANVVNGALAGGFSTLERSSVYTAPIAQLTRTIPKEIIKEAPAGTIIPTSKSVSDYTTRTTSVPIFAFAPSQSLISGQAIVQAQTQPQSQRLRQPQQQEQGLAPSSFSIPSRGFSFDSGPRFGWPPFATLPFGIPTGKKGRAIGKRKLIRTPSFGAVFKQFELGFKQPKYSESLEQTALVERAFVAPQMLPQMGIKKKKKRKR